MKEKQKKGKRSNTFKSLWGKLQGTAKKTAAATKQGVQALAIKKEQAEWSARLKKYNPLFPEEYTAESFHLPNVLRIVDDAERRDIDVCKGAIGWRSKENGVEVLHLYDEAVPFSGLNFLPMPVCDTLYTVHPYNRNLFISVKEYEGVIQQERMAELQEIAFALGAKRYFVEMVEEKGNQANAGVGVGENIGIKLKEKKKEKTERQVHLVCKGGGKPYEPKLCYFKEDKNVQYLVKQRCSKRGKKMREHTLQLHTGTNVLHSATLELAMKFGKQAENKVSVGAGGGMTNTSSKSMVVMLEF